MRKVSLEDGDLNKLKRFTDDFYTMIIEYLEDDELYCISFPELPECEAKGETLKKALKNRKNAKWTWGSVHLYNGHTLPKSKNKKLDDRYIFVRLSKKEKYKLNKIAWELKRSPSDVAKLFLIKSLQRIDNFIQKLKRPKAESLFDLNDVLIPASFGTGEKENFFS